VRAAVRGAEKLPFKWQEGIARYTQIKAAEAAADYQPTVEYAALADFEPFSARPKARTENLNELSRQIYVAAHVFENR
jgi:hypothetical protein